MPIIRKIANTLIVFTRYFLLFVLYLSLPMLSCASLYYVLVFCRLPFWVYWGIFFSCLLLCVFSSLMLVAFLDAIGASEDGEKRREG